MNKSLKKFVFVTAAILFLLNSANISLYLHLAEHKNDAEHDHNKCPICQQAVTNKTKAIVSLDPVVVEQQQVASADVYAIEHIIKNFKFLTPYLRAPPALS